MKKLLLLLLIPVVCYAQGELDPANINKKYSHKHLCKQSFKKVDVKEFNNTIITGSNFYWEWQEGDKSVVKDVFPDNMTGVTFINCNLDNILVPDGNEIIGGTNKKIQRQNDWDDWILNDNLEPVEPLTKEQRIRSGYPVQSNSIPLQKWTKEQYTNFMQSLH